MKRKIFRRDYTLDEVKEDLSFERVFQALGKSGFIDTLKEYDGKAVKIVDEKRKKRYSVTLCRANKIAKEYHGRLFGSINPYSNLAWIRVELPCFDFLNHEEYKFMRYIISNSDNLTINAVPNDEFIQINIYFKYFIPLVTKEQKEVFNKKMDAELQKAFRELLNDK